MMEEGNSGIPATMLVGPTGYGAMPAPVYSQGNSFGEWWIILLFIVLFAAGGWNNGNNGNGHPVVINEANGYAQRGFDQAAIMAGINGVQTGINGLGMQMCDGFNGVNMAIMNSQYNLTLGLNNLQAALAQSACENRLGIADLKYTVATENCADRTQSMINTRDIIDVINNRAQGIENKLCQLELDGVKQNYENRIAGMQNVIDGLNAQVNKSDRRVAIGEEIDALYNRLNNCPVPTTPVYGRTPIFTCNQNQGAFCGCGA
jgi:hypothetical protein